MLELSSSDSDNPITNTWIAEKLKGARDIACLFEKHLTKLENRFKLEPNIDGTNEASVLMVKKLRKVVKSVEANLLLLDDDILKNFKINCGEDKISEILIDKFDTDKIPMKITVEVDKTTENNLVSDDPPHNEGPSSASNSTDGLQIDMSGNASDLDDDLKSIETDAHEINNLKTVISNNEESIKDTPESNDNSGKDVHEHDDNSIKNVSKSNMFEEKVTECSASADNENNKESHNESSISESEENDNNLVSVEMSDGSLHSVGENDIKAIEQSKKYLSDLFATDSSDGADNCLGLPSESESSSFEYNGHKLKKCKVLVKKLTFKNVKKISASEHIKIDNLFKFGKFGSGKSVKKIVKGKNKKSAETVSSDESNESINSEYKTENEIIELSDKEKPVASDLDGEMPSDYLSNSNGSQSDSSVEIIKKYPVNKRSSTRKSDGINSHGHTKPSILKCGIDSSEEDSDPKKKNRRNKDTSDEDSDFDINAHRQKSRVRKRIRNSGYSSNSSSDFDLGKRAKKKVKSKKESDSDSENILTSSQKGRKNIRKIFKSDDLGADTKEAIQQEEERRKRVLEKQKIYNSIVLSEAGKSAVVDKIELDFDSTTKESIVKVNEAIVKYLKPHQANGIKFLWDACIESIERCKASSGGGCILAHNMGLGKSLQVIAFIHTLMTHDLEIHRAMIVCPVSTVLNWVNEFRTWLDDNGLEDLEVFDLTFVKSNHDRVSVLRKWFKSGGVMIIGYELFRILGSSHSKKIKKHMKEQLQKYLVDPGADILVCDEGHLLKNEASASFRCLNCVKTKRRIILTGTPLQNNLKEYHCMIQFVKPNLLGNLKEFTNQFVNPIKNGQCLDSTPRDVKIMKRRAHILYRKLQGCVQRLDYSVLTPYLPKKLEYVLSIKLSELQIQLYRFYLEQCGTKGSKRSLFSDFQNLSRIWSHPKLILMKHIKDDIKRMLADDDSEGSLVDFIDDESEGEDSVTTISDSSDSNKQAGVKDNKTASRSTRNNPVDEIKEESPEVSNDGWWKPVVEDDTMLEPILLSGKLALLLELLKTCEMIGDKVLVFSQSLFSLDLIQGILENGSCENDKELAEQFNLGHWVKGEDFYRLDGSTASESRKSFIDQFNDEDNMSARLFLISTKAGGLGINLIGANRVVIFDASWNPTHDIQSIFRTYRFGQKKPVYVYRFIAQGTMEEKVYERQVTKQSLACRVIDEQQIGRHFTSSDLSELYEFSPIENPTETLNVPEDKLFAEILQNDNKGKKWVIKYHIHDSLLENVQEEELTEEERKVAWEEFENERLGTLSAADIEQLRAEYPHSKFDVQEIAKAFKRMNPNSTYEELKARVSYHLKAHAMETVKKTILQQAMETNTFREQQRIFHQPFIGNSMADDPLKIDGPSNPLGYLLSPGALNALTPRMPMTQINSSNNVQPPSLGKPKTIHIE